MTFTRSIFLPALLTLGLALAGPAGADPSKNGGGKNGGGGHSHGGGKNGGGTRVVTKIVKSGGNGDTIITNGVKCHVNGNMIRVVSRAECDRIGGFVRHGSKAKKVVTYTYQQDCGCQATGHKVIRYYAPASRAARMQAEARMKRHHHHHAEGHVVIVKKKKRIKRVAAPVIYETYDPGVVIHYGPVVSKSGGY